MDPKAEEKRIRLTLWIVGAAILVVAGVWGWWMLPGAWPPGEGMTNRGAWGDSFAPLAILVNGAAIILALWSVTLQRLELRAALQEMKEQSAHLKYAAEEQKLANALQLNTNALQEQANQIQREATLGNLITTTSHLAFELSQTMADYEYHKRVSKRGAGRDVLRDQIKAEVLRDLARDLMPLLTSHHQMSQSILKQSEASTSALLAEFLAQMSARQTDD